MTTSTVTDLEALLAQLGVKVPIPQFPAADVLKCPLDIGRSYLADFFCSLLECDPEVAYKSIHWPNDISSGDLAVILPKLSQGGDSNAVGFDLINKVWHLLFFPLWKTLLVPYLGSRIKNTISDMIARSSPNARFSCFLSTMVFIFE